MKYPILALVICSCFIFSCSNSNDSVKTDSVVSSDSSFQNAVPAAKNTVLQEPATNNTTGNQSPDSPGSGISPAQQTATAPGMNPPHGAPGHRCEIPVGAPPNSTAAANAAANFSNGTTNSPVNPIVKSGSPTNTPSPSITASPSGTLPTTTAPGMNPPHGQPGHDCAIAVGAPLKK